MSKRIRNRVTERDIRDWLNSHGYEGGSATLENVELIAIKRPGWEQLFQFTGSLRRQSDDPEETLPKTPVWGLALDDERSRGEKTQVILCDSLAQQQEQLEKLSADMLKINRPAERTRGTLMLLGMFVFALVLLFLIAILKQMNG